MSVRQEAANTGISKHQCLRLEQAKPLKAFRRVHHRETLFCFLAAPMMLRPLAGNATTKSQHCTFNVEQIVDWQLPGCTTDVQVCL